MGAKARGACGGRARALNQLWERTQLTSNIRVTTVYPPPRSPQVDVPERSDEQWSIIRFHCPAPESNACPMIRCKSISIFLTLVCLSVVVCLSVLYVCLFACLSVYLSVRLSVSLLFYIPETLGEKKNQEINKTCGCPFPPSNDVFQHCVNKTCAT